MLRGKSAAYQPNGGSFVAFPVQIKHSSIGALHVRNMLVVANMMQAMLADLRVEIT